MNNMNSRFALLVSIAVLSAPVWAATKTVTQRTGHDLPRVPNHN